MADTGDGVPAYASPALAHDLSGPPDTCVDTGSAEVLRDEETELRHPHPPGRPGTNYGWPPGADRSATPAAPAPFRPRRR